MRLFRSTALAIGLSFSSIVVAQENGSAPLGSTITGNQEQPKVLYIVPWKQTKDTSILDSSLDSRLSDVFDHVERREHKREIQYIETLVQPESATSNQP